MKHKNDLKIKIDKEPRKKENILKRIVIIAILLLIVIFVLNKAENYLKEKTANEINLVLNNKNVTANLKHEIIEENGNIYMSMDDIKNYFDKYINIEDEINEIVTTYDKQIASIGFETNKLTLNGATKKIGQNVMLMVNDRRFYSDTFWFTLFHEIGHIINGDYGITFENEHAGQEDAADKYAEDKLIPPGEYEAFVKMNEFSENAIRRFAERIDRDPGIVLGRLQNDQIVPFTNVALSKALKHKYKVITS